MNPRGTQASVNIVHLDSIDSTNLEAQRRWNAQLPITTPLVVRANKQTAGIGRNGRHWTSPVGGLWLSIAWPMSLSPERYEALTPLIADAVARTMNGATGLACLVKWPNDVLVGDKKLAGVLCQSTLDAGPRCVVVGIGINANFPATSLPAALRMPATTLHDQLGRPVDLNQLEEKLVPEVIASLEAFNATHGA